MEAVEVDLGRHRSSQLTQESIRRADLILGMSPLHVQHALRESPDARGKTFLLKEFARSDLKNIQISDPMGCTLEVFKKCFKEIRQACDKLIETEYVKALIPPPDREPKPRPVAETAPPAKTGAAKAGESDAPVGAEKPKAARTKSKKSASGKAPSTARAPKKTASKPASGKKAAPKAKPPQKAPKSAPKPAAKKVPLKAPQKAPKKASGKATPNRKTAPAKKKASPAGKSKFPAGKK
jgi:hypothetical protein